MAFRGYVRHDAGESRAHFAFFSCAGRRDGRADRQRLRAAGKGPAQEDELVVGAQWAGLFADRVDHHLVAALNADQQARSAVVPILHEHLAELGEFAADQLFGRRQQENLVVVAADREQLLVELGHSVKQRRPRQKMQPQGIG